MFASLWRNRRLVLQMSKREVIGRYRGSAFGLAWSFFNPILMLTVYTFVFSVVFKARWGTDTSDKGSFALLLFVGMIVHGLFAECVNRAPALIVSNANYVKKVVFPLEALPWIAMGGALFHAFISSMVLLAAQLLIKHSMPWTVIFFPFTMLPLVLIAMAASWFLAAIGVYLRDVSQTVTIITTVLMFLSPVFYPISALPEKYRIWLELNPLTTIIEEARNSLVLGIVPNWQHLGFVTAFGIVIAWAGFSWFQKTRKGFADVL